MLEAVQLEGGKDRGVVTAHDVVRAAVRSVDDTGAGIRAPQHTVAVGWHVDTDLETKKMDTRIHHLTASL